MKIEGPSKSNVTSPTRRAGMASGGGLDPSLFLGLMGAGEASEFTPTSATQNIAALDVLLTVQSADDPTERAARKRMTARADAILTTLDDLRMGILTGTLTIGHMIDVADVVAAHREKIHDPQLTAILDEIDLRAQVEIAKLSMTYRNGV